MPTSLLACRRCSFTTHAQPAWQSVPAPGTWDVHPHITTGAHRCTVAQHVIAEPWSQLQTLVQLHASSQRASCAPLCKSGPLFTSLLANFQNQEHR